MTDALIVPVRPRNIQTFHPGVVGSVGDVNVKPRFRNSTPDMPVRFDPFFEGNKGNILGANVQDGNTTSYVDKGGPAHTRDSRWGGNRSFKTQYGWEHHDVQSPDKRTEPWVSNLGDYMWRNKVATIRQARRTGNLFLPLPGGYLPEPDDLLRGGSYPRTDVIGGDPPPGEPRVVGIPILPFPNPVIAQPLNRTSNALPFTVGKKSVGLGRPKIL